MCYLSGVLTEIIIVIIGIHNYLAPAERKITVSDLKIHKPSRLALVYMAAAAKMEKIGTKTAKMRTNVRTNAVTDLNLFSFMVFLLFLFFIF